MRLASCLSIVEEVKVANWCDAYTDSVGTFIHNLLFAHTTNQSTDKRRSEREQIADKKKAASNAIFFPRWNEIGRHKNNVRHGARTLSYAHTMVLRSGKQPRPIMCAGRKMHCVHLIDVFACDNYV